MDTQTITVLIAHDDGIRETQRIGALARKAIGTAIEVSPHEVLDVDWDPFKGTLVVTLASDDLANATTILREAIADLDGVTAPLTETVYR